jgi:hypothetical protein
LEKYARALKVPMYKLFSDGDGQPQKPKLHASMAEPTWGATKNERRELHAFARVLSRLDDRQRNLLMTVASRMVRRKGSK